MIVALGSLWNSWPSSFASPLPPGGPSYNQKTTAHVNVSFGNGGGGHIMSDKDGKSVRKNTQDSLTTRHIEQSSDALLRTLTTEHIQQKLETVNPAQNQGKPDNTSSGSGGSSAPQQGSGAKK